MGGAFMWYTAIYAWYKRVYLPSTNATDFYPLPRGVRPLRATRSHPVVAGPCFWRPG